MSHSICQTVFLYLTYDKVPFMLFKSTACAVNIFKRNVCLDQVYITSAKPDIKCSFITNHLQIMFHPVLPIIKEFKIVHQYVHVHNS